MRKPVHTINLPHSLLSPVSAVPNRLRRPTAYHSLFVVKLSVLFSTQLCVSLGNQNKELVTISVSEADSLLGIPSASQLSSGL